MIIALPFVCVFLVFADIAIKKGDANPPALIVAQQQTNSDLVYMPTWTRADQFYYKFTAVNQIQPDVLIIGSSRVYHWRSDIMFDEHGSGYNAGLPSAEPLEVAWFLDGLAAHNHLPDVMILAIDDLFFNQDGTFVRSNRVENVIPPLDYSFDYALNGIRLTAQDYSQHPQQILHFYRNYQPSNLSGEVARSSGRGYRADGSFQFPDLYDVSPQLIDNHQWLYDNGDRIFQHGDSIYEPSMAAIEHILQLASENDVTVIGIFTPYNSEHYERMLSSGNYSYIPEVRRRIRLMFDNYGMPLYDYTYADTVGGSNEELYDYLHAGEVLGLRVYYDMLLTSPEIFAAYSNISRIEQILNRVDNRFFLPQEG